MVGKFKIKEPGDLGSGERFLIFKNSHFLAVSSQGWGESLDCLLVQFSRPAAAAAKLLQSCPTLCDPTRTLEWVAISFANAWKWKVKVKSLSRVRPSVTLWTAAHQAPPSLGFSRQEHWRGLPFPPPMHESEKWKWSHSVVSDSSDPMDCSLPGSSVHGIF